MNGYGKFIPSLLGMLFHKPNTANYPQVMPMGADNYRGALKYFADKCVGCKLCERGCPSDAIVIEKVADKQFKAIVLLDRCIFCGQCVDSCRFGALENTSDFELATLIRDDLKVEI